MVLWQESQDAVVGICPEGLPLAAVPLWQLAQLPAATLEWLNLAGVQADVLWQLSQGAEVAMWPDGLPLALLLLWQVEQVPEAMPK